MDIQAIYDRLPPALQNALLGYYGLRLNRSRYGRAYAEGEREVFAREFLDAESLRVLCAARLRHVVAEAAGHVPYYRRLFSQLGVRSEDIRTPADLHFLPRLTRQEVQANLEDFYHERWRDMRPTMVKTSGTTGTGLVFPVALAAEREQWAVWWRYRARFGITRGTWYAHFYGRTVVPASQDRPPYWRVNVPGRQIFFSAYHMREDCLGAYVDELNRRQPPWIQGYPSLLALLAGYIVGSGRTLDYRPQAVTTGSETLMPQQKALIEKAFGVPCHQHYGTTEGMVNISECPEGRLHVDEDFGHVEFADNGSGSHRILATGYSNTAFILLRYDLGDDVSLPEDPSPCACGRPGRLVETIDGRIEDYVVTPSGARIGRLDHIFKDVITVREAQIAQNDPGSVEIRIVPGPEFRDADEEKLQATARKYLGPEVAIRIRRVEAVERSRTGKLRFMVSTLARGAGALAESDRNIH